MEQIINQYFRQQADIILGALHGAPVETEEQQVLVVDCGTFDEKPQQAA